MIEEIELESINQELVMLALNKFTDVFDRIQPYQQKELLKLALHKAILAPDSIKIALYGRPPEQGYYLVCLRCAPRHQSDSNLWTRSATFA
jgi:hypothetical protein